MLQAAAIDIGSNAIRLAIGHFDDKGKLVVVENRREAIRLGQDVFTEGKISDITMRRVEDAFLEFQRLCTQHLVQTIRAVGTSALREAKNQSDFISYIKKKTDVSIECIKGEEEAQLIHLGVCDKINLHQKIALLIDIGGGSIEVTLVDDGEIISSDTAPMGTVRLLKLLEDQKQPIKTLNKLIREYANGIKQQISRDLRGRKIDLAVGTGGNIECMGELRKEFLGGKSNNEIHTDELASLVEQLQPLSYQERMDTFHLRPDRADVIFPAATVLLGILQQAKVEELHIPNAGVKDGILVDLLTDAAVQKTKNRSTQLYMFARELGRKYDYNEAHGHTVSQLAGQLFDQTRKLHKLPDHYRLLLELGAVLHDIGQYISYNAHQKHSWYLITACPFVGLNEREQFVVAAVARYHRKAAPKPDHEAFAKLHEDDREPVCALAALIRIADALDREHASLVKNIEVELKSRECILTLCGEGDLLLERWAVKKKAKLFEELFETEVRVA